MPVRVGEKAQLCVTALATGSFENPVLTLTRSSITCR